MTGKLRLIPLAQVACELGLDPDWQGNHKWRNEAHQINITGEKFYDWQRMKGGGGAIALVMHVEDCNFTEALDWLGDRFGAAGTLQMVTQQVAEQVESKQQKQFLPPVPQEENWGRVREELTQKRKLPSALIDQLHRDGLLYANEGNNAVFLRRNWNGTVTGATLYGTSDVHGLATGTRRSQGWFYTVFGGDDKDRVEQVVLVEGAIQGLAYQVLHPHRVRTMVLSADGMGYLPWEELRAVEKVEIALNRDANGDEMAQWLQSELPKAERLLPINQNWHEDLQQQMRKMQQMFQKRQQEQNMKDGLSL